MIGKIKGTLVEINNNEGLIETQSGLSYLVFLTSHLLSSLHPPTAIDLYTYLQVRDDALILFGFETKKEFDMFKLLLTVPGVGPKSAYSVTSFFSVDDLIGAIKENNADFVSRVPGLGKKTAMKIILELSQKLDSEFKMENMYLTDDDKTVIDALVSLGFKSAEAKAVLGKIPKDQTVEKRIQEAIKIASGKNKKG